MFFLHLPKCGGTSLLHALTRDGGTSLIVSGKARTKEEVLAPVRAMPVPARERIRMVGGHRVSVELAPLFPAPPLFVTVVRHPVSLYTSLYNYWLDIARDPDHPLRERNVGRMLDGDRPLGLEEWLQQDGHWPNLYARFFARAEQGELAPGQPLDVVGPDELRAANAFLDRCRFVLAQEHAAVDFPALCRTLGVAPPEVRARVSTPHAVVMPGTPRWREVEAIISARAPADLDLHARAMARRAATVMALPA